jgi:cell division protein FtsL
MFKKKDIFFICLVIFLFLGTLLTVNTKYTALTYKYNSEVNMFAKLSKENRKLNIRLSSLSSPERIIDYATKHLGLTIPRGEQVYSIEKH